MKFIIACILISIFVFRMLQGAFLIYAVGVGSGLATIVLEIYLVWKKLNDKSQARTATTTERKNIEIR